MSVGIGVIGRQVTMTVGGQTLLGTITKAFTATNELLDTTDDASAGWQEFLAVAGKKAFDFTMSGTVKNYELLAAFFGSSQIFPAVVTLPDGSTVTFDAALESFAMTGESNGLQTFDAPFKSSGAAVFVAGT